MDTRRLADPLAEADEAEIHDADADARPGVAGLVPERGAHRVRRTVGVVDRACLRQVGQLRRPGLDLHPGVAQAGMPRQFGERANGQRSGDGAGEDVAGPAQEHVSRNAPALADEGREVSQRPLVLHVHRQRDEPAARLPLALGGGGLDRCHGRPDAAAFVVHRGLAQQRTESGVVALAERGQGGHQPEQ